MAARRLGKRTVTVSARSTPQLVLIDPSGARTQVPIGKTPFTIGRLSDNDLPLRDSRISRHHAAIVLENGHYAVQDQNSRHGTFVNGERVETVRPLRNNDRIEFGVPGSYVLLFVSEEESLARLLERVDTPAPAAGTTSRELRNLNLLLEVGRSLQAGLALEDVLATVVDACLKVTGTQRGFLFLRNERGELTLEVGRDHQKRSLGPGDFQGSPAFVEEIVRGSQDIVITNPRGEPRAVIGLALPRLPHVASLETTLTEYLPEALGVIYLDTQLSSQVFSESDKQVLRSLAMEAVGVIENARLFTAARDKERLEHELAIARDIQQALLPKRFRRHPGFQVAGINIPSQQVGGDYYDLVEIPGQRYAFVVADVSGKGISAALLTSMLQGALAAMLELGQPVGAVARQLNRYLCQRSEMNRFATFFFAVLAPGGRLEYINAGHVPPLFLPAGGDARVLRAESLPLGLFEEGEFAAQVLGLQPGDTLVLYTDGFIDATNPRGETYGLERLKKAVARFSSRPAEELAQAVLGDVREFARETPPEDDMTLLVVRYEGNA
ncbi:MAG: SpoIIE family protein phosphatase [Acidobacteria bacterium]|nr:SpoIIE family protein phosphatase [Acidobacteriota bacterium]